MRAGERKDAAGIADTRSATEPFWACPQEACDAIVDPPAHRIGARRLAGGAIARFALPAGGSLAGAALEGGGENGGYDPQDLRSAYKVPASGGADQTVALVDAFGYPEAEKDLAVYRERYGLPPCTKGNGCFHKVNQNGKEGGYPSAKEGWETESALDIEMVSAACPECHILLVEADTNAGTALAEAEDTAVKLGATEISNSWGSPEQECGPSLCAEEAADFDHPGVLITVSGGDNGYDDEGLGGRSPDYPSSLPDVVAVGGTALHKAENERGWSEEAWVDGGSGCSRFAKPEWQHDPSCAGRMTVDVAADAACETPVSTYSIRKWNDVCGTSVSSPLIAGIEAHAPEYARTLPGAEAFYKDPGALFDVANGSNGKCTPPKEDAYFCHAEAGYDGPTGNGTPDGPLTLTSNGPPTVEGKPASDVGATSATLNGLVAPDGQETTYRFEYGSTTSYGTNVPTPEASSGTNGQAVSQSVSGLSPESVYHYRLVASSAAGTTYGEDVAFTTAAPAVAGVAPSSGAAHGGSTVTITGENFLGASAVKFGVAEASSFVVDSETTITAVAPPGTGPVDVTVISGAGSSETSPADLFSYEKLGPVLAWGYNNGLLGDGTRADSEVPVEVSSLPEAASLAVGGYQDLAVLKADGRVMGWGENKYGTVGNGSEQAQLVPVGVCAPGLTSCPDGPYLEEATAVSAGVEHSLALLKDGTVMAWGNNLFGQLGSDPRTGRSSVPVPVCMTVEAPCKPENYLKEVKEIAAGGYFSLALLDNGTVLAWGWNTAGQLGQPSRVKQSEVPLAVPGLSHVTAIAAGWGSGLALPEDGRVMAWGENRLGELGDNTTKDDDAPAAVCAVGESAKGCKRALEGVTAIAAGDADGYAVLANGTVAAWGLNMSGQLGDDTPSGPTTCKLGKNPEPLLCSLHPVGVKSLEEVSAIASGPVSLSVLAQLKSGELVSWGDGGAGVLGDGETANSEQPVPVCMAYAPESCPSGPDLAGQLTAMAAGEDEIVSFSASPGPAVDGVQPSAGSSGGGTSVTIIGTGFVGVTAVDFGGAPAGEFSVQSADEIVASAPPGSGTVDVSVSGAEGTSPPTPNDRFTYRGAPTVFTDEPTDVGPEMATLRASVNSGDEALTECYFEYGTTPAYGSSEPCSSLPGAGTSAESVSATVIGLEEGTTYYYRAVASNAEGAGYGTQQSFTTNALPQLGRCVELIEKTGAYGNPGCTTPSAEENGKYEWQPWPFANEDFSGSGGALRFETVTFKNKRGKSVDDTRSCSASAVSGEYTSSESASISVTYTGCGYCHSSGASSGEIRTGPLEAQLGLVDTGSKPKAGWILNPYSESPLAECEIFGSVVGSVIGSVSATNEMSRSFQLSFTGKHGHQLPEMFEDGLEQTLELDGHRAALTTSASLEGSEEIEIKTLP